MSARKSKTQFFREQKLIALDAAIKIAIARASAADTVVKTANDIYNWLIDKKEIDKD